MYSIREFENFCQEKYYSLCNEYPVMFDVDDEIGTFVSFKYENSFLRDIDSVERIIYTNYPNIKIFLHLGKGSSGWGIQTRGEGYFPNFDSAFNDAGVTEEMLQKRPIKIKSLKDKIYYRKKRK